MDPLSITAAIVGISTVALKVTKSLSDLLSRYHFFEHRVLFNEIISTRSQIAAIHVARVIHTEQRNMISSNIFV